MDLITTIGFLAAFCTTTAFAPQAIKAFKTKHTADISLWMTILFVVGITLWLIYGIFLSSYPLIAANAVSLLLAGSLLGLKIKYG